MKLIIGLGNPGKEYEATRHNAGFLFADVLRERWHFPEFSEEKKFSSFLSSGTRGIEKTLLVKPVTFMNRSGEAVSELVNFYKLTPDDILVIHDDLDLPFGTWKVATSSGAAGHNGVADIIEKLGTKEFRRIRIGIGRPPENIPADRYVLESFSSDETERLPELFGDILEGI